MLEISAILCGMAVLVEILALLFARSDGKGCRFITGYNLASKEVRQKYDEKRICQFMGKEFAVLGAGFLLGAIIALFWDKKGFLFVAIFFVMWFVHHSYIWYKKFDEMFQKH